MEHDDLLRMIASLFLGYVFAIIYNAYLVSSSLFVKHMSNIIFGISICYFNFGTDTIHSLATCLVVWSTIRLLGATQTMLALNFTFCVGYLMYGYYQKIEVHSTRITWTLPQCVLTLALIALSFDYYDDSHKHTKKDDDEDKDKEDSSTKNAPSLLLILSKVYFPPTFLIGPQVRFSHFKQFMNLKQSYMNECWKSAILRLSLGLFYYGLFQIGQLYFPLSYLSTKEFESYSLVSKLLLFGIVSKVTLCKYLGAWLVVEGSCILYGVSRDPHTGQMDRCFNMSLLYYETSPTFGGLIESFNMSTNYFAMTYIYKRLRFLGSKVASQAITLFFLAFWHGYASGYYVTFFMEMIIMKMEKDISTMVIKYRTRNQWLNRLLNRTSIRIIIHILMRVHVVAMFGYAFLPFGVLHYENYAPIYEQVYYVGHLLYGTWFVASCFFDF